MVNLGSLYSSRFNSLYIRNDEICNGNIISSKDELCGYFEYRLCDEEDEIRVKNQVRNSLIDVLNSMIENNELQNKISNISDNVSDYTSKIELKPIKQLYKDNVEFTLYTRIYFE